MGGEVVHLDPFQKKKELGEKSLPHLLKDLRELEYVDYILCPSDHSEDAEILRCLQN